MARTYREIAIEDMVRLSKKRWVALLTLWGDSPAAMKEAVEEFRTQPGVPIDSVEFVKRAADRQAPETDSEEALADVSCECIVGPELAGVYAVLSVARNDARGALSPV